MNGDQLFLLLFLGLLGASGISFLTGSRRTATEVLEDLDPEELSAGAMSGAKPKGEQERELVAAGLLGREEQRAFLAEQKRFPLLGMLLFPLVRFLLGGASLSALALAAVFGLSLGYLVSRRRLGNLQRQYIRNIEFFLPVVMERLVMAVQSGLDVFAAIDAVLRLEEHESEKDPVTRLLGRAYRLTEQGVSFEDSLKIVSEQLESPPLRHAFIHLAVAHKEGGELTYPLRELSDATQLYYQETVEHDIARLPVKATMPLLVTFVGLILLFITTPILQVLELTGKMSTP